MASVFDDLVRKLVQGGIESPRLEARMLLAFITNQNVSDIFTDINLNDEQKKHLTQLLSRRLAHEPLDKIIGYREFYKATFKVSDKVLSPRPDTEILVEAALQLLPDDKPATILDLGTGSGCIIESLLIEKPLARGVAVDISAEALAVAQENAGNLGIENRLDFVQADWFDADFAERLTQKFDMIVSNPPYIPSQDIAKLMSEVKNYDPMLALDGGVDGFDSYKRIAELMPNLLKTGGHILLEAGKGQAAQIAEIFSAQGLHLLNIYHDLADIERCVVMEK